MKKFAAAVIAAILTMSVGAGSVLAAFPPIQYAKGEKVVVSWNNMTEIDTMPPGNVSFTVECDSKSSVSSQYVVEYTIGDKPKVTSTIDVPAASKKSQKFTVNLDAGLYDTQITVSKDGNTLYSNEEQISVMQHYTGEWGDKLTRRGWATHVTAYNSQKPKDIVPYYFLYSGAQGYRDGSNWEYVEKTRGTMSYSNLKSWYGEMAKSGIKMSHLNGCGNGWLYLPERDMKLSAGWDVHTRSNIPQTDDSIMAFARYMTGLAKYSAENLNAYTLETWNEFNSKVQRQEDEEVAQIFTDSVRPIRIHMMMENDETLDNMDISGFTSGGWNEFEWMQAGFDQDFYPFIDRISVHRYAHTGGFETSNSFYEGMKDYVEFITEQGGWKKVDDTETGCTNPVDSKGFATWESADWEMPLRFVSSEYADVDWTYIYDLKNDGPSSTYTEDNFGSMTYDWKPKPQYLAYTNFNNMTSGGMMMGLIDAGLPAGAKAYMYYKDGEPVIIAWANLPDNSDVEWNIGGNVKVYDNHGTLVTESTDKVVLKGSPIYIMNADRSYITNSVKVGLIEKANDFMSRFEDVLTPELKTKAQNVFDNMEEKLVGEPDEKVAYDVYKSYMALGNDIIAAGGKGELTEKDTSSMIYSLYLAAKRANNLYAASYTGDVPEKVSDGWRPRYNDVRKNNYDNVSIQQYTDAMLKYIRDHVNEAKELFALGENPQKAGMIQAINTLTDDMCVWYDNFASYETVRDLSLTVQTPYYDRHTYANTDVTTEVNLHNYGKTLFKGKITVTDEDGKQLYESAPLSVLPNGGYTQTSVTVNVPKPTKSEEPGEFSSHAKASKTLNSSVAPLYINYVNENGEILHSQRTDYVIGERFSVRALPVTDTIENFKNIKFEITNVSDEEQKASIEVESDGSFKLYNSNQDVTIPANESTIVEIPISDLENSKFHFHSFNYKVKDALGNIVVDDSYVISFTNIVKAKNPINIDEFDGDISDWEDAYPIYVNAPKNPTEKSSWTNAGCSTRAFAKWDENNLYLLIDVYDDTYLQTYSGTNIWNGDSVQIGIDPKNDKNVNSYAQDDYEIGITNGLFGNETYFWQAPSSSAASNGVVDWIKSVRNDTEHYTRYLVVLNSSILSGVDLKEGTTIGMNYAVNDSDILVRDAFYQFTNGVADKKDPSQWADFNFIGIDNSQRKDGIASSIFPIKAESNVVTE